LFYYSIGDIFSNWSSISKELDRSTRKQKVIYELASKIKESVSNRSEHWYSENDTHYRNITQFFNEVPNELFVQTAQTMLGFRNDSNLKEKLSENSILLRVFDNYAKPKLRDVFKNSLSS
jgi:hypothetical protein